MPSPWHYVWHRESVKSHELSLEAPTSHPVPAQGTQFLPSCGSEPLQSGFRALRFIQTALLSPDHVLFETPGLVAMEDRHSQCPGESWDNKRCLVPSDQNIPPATVARAPARPGRGIAIGRPVHEEDQSCVQPRQAPSAGCARSCFLIQLMSLWIRRLLWLRRAARSPLQTGLGRK